MTTPAASSPAAPPAVVTAWQAALAAEHAAVFGYGSLGVHLPEAEQATARSLQTAHLSLRDATATALRAAGHDPVRSLGDYPFAPVATAAAARGLALRLEDATADAWRVLVLRCAAAGGPATVRATAGANLTAAAVRALTWRSALTPSAPFDAFPGS